MKSPVLLVAALRGPLFERAVVEARRHFPGAPLLAVVHWRANGTLPADVTPWLASEHRDRPDRLVRALRQLGPAATVVVCEGAPGATMLKALGLAVGGRRLVVREDGSAYRFPNDVLGLGRHALDRLAPGIRRALATVGAVLGVPVLLVGAVRWRLRRRAERAQ